MAIFYINSKNLFNNLNVIKSYLKPNIKLCAMVKADAYSHSSKHICKLLCDKVDYFGVANIQEGIAIRKLKISTPILCVGTFFKEDLRLASKFNIDLTIHSKQCLKILKNTKKSLNVHIKIDTGMARLGFRDINEFKFAINTLETLKNVKIKGIFSHFLDSLNKDSVQDQNNKFKAYFRCLKDASIIKHISNSNGLMNSSLNYDMCRVGMYLYGYGNIDGLRPVLEIESCVIDIHSLTKGESVGYDRKFIAKGKTRVATIPFGYADGLDMRYSGSCVVINQKKYKIIGNICMDMFMCEVDQSVKIGDKVKILGDAEEFAKHANKSVYEVLSNFKNKRSKIIIK